MDDPGFNFQQGQGIFSSLKHPDNVWAHQVPIQWEMGTLNLPMMTIVAQPFNVIKWQLKFNLVA